MSKKQKNNKRTHRVTAKRPPMFQTLETRNPLAADPLMGAGFVPLDGMDGGQALVAQAEGNQSRISFNDRESDALLANLLARMEALESRVDDLETDNVNLEARVTDLETENAAQQTAIDTLETENAAQQTAIDTLDALLDGVSRIGAGGSNDTLRLTGMNLQVVDGTGDTGGTPNGLGNVIIGYNNTTTFADVDDQSGSHNLVVGDDHTFNQNSTIVVGLNNAVTGTLSSVTGGFANTASGPRSFVGGGENNTANGLLSFVGGGIGNTASGDASFAGGGFDNAAIGYQSFVGGGGSNEASGLRSFVGGGGLNEASSQQSFVGAGFRNTASGNESFVGGGVANTASGLESFVGGGRLNLADSMFEAILGGEGP